MAAQLPDLRPLKGRHRVYRFHGADGLGRRPYRTFLVNTSVVSDPDELREEGPGHVGHEHLIFSSCVANEGDGPLILEMRKTSKRRARVVQVIPDDALPPDQWKRRSAGKAILDTNPDHNHWHYEDFLSYRLTRAGKTRRALKQSFCLEDVAKLRTDAGRRQFTHCPRPRAKVGRMGIAPGWGDVYWAGVQEQFFEVKGLPDGTYWLECTVDIRKRLQLKSRAHLVTRARVRVRR